MSNQSWICNNTQHRSVRLSYSRTEIRLLVHCLNCGFNSKYVLREFILIFLKVILSYNEKKSQFSMFYLLCFESKLKQCILVKGLYIAITWTLKTLKNRLYRALKFNPSVTKKGVWGTLKVTSKVLFCKCWNDTASHKLFIYCQIHRSHSL